jgi:CRISPR/Cas system-associated endonuclease Cas1
MPSLYIDRANLCLETRAKTVEVRRGDALVARYPLVLLNHLVVLAHCHIDSPLVLAMSEQGGAISVIDVRGGRSAMLLEDRCVSAWRRRAQSDLLSDPSRRVSWAGRLVASARSCSNPVPNLVSCAARPRS